MTSDPKHPDKPIILVGLMGAGKTCIGHRLAIRYGLPFTDADEEIAKAAGCSVEDIFKLYGEAAFRDGERRVIDRLLGEGPMVLAAGGGAFMDPDIRRRIKESAVSVWLRADLEILVERTARRGGRPLLKNGGPRAILAALIDERYPVYAGADIVVDSDDVPPEVTIAKVSQAIDRFLRAP